MTTKRVSEVVGVYSMTGSRRMQAPGNLRVDRPVTGNRGSLKDDVEGEEQYASQQADSLPKAVATYVTKGDKILAVSRGTNLSDMNMPGGHVEMGEDPMEAAKRELWEETGIRALELFPVYSRVSDGYLVSTYRVTKYSGKISSSDEGQARWVKPEEVLRSSFGEYFVDMIRDLYSSSSRINNYSF